MRSDELHDSVVVSVSISRADGDVVCVDLNTDLDDVGIGAVGPEPVAVRLTLDELELQPGRYYVDVGVYPLDWAHAYDYHWHAYPLTVRGGEDSAAIYRPRRRRWRVDRSAGRQP